MPPRFLVRGGRSLRGSIRPAGNKNAALPILASTVLADVRRTIDPNSVWSRFTGGRNSTIRWYRRVYDRLKDLGFTGEIMQEFGRVVVDLEAWTDDTVPVAP